MCAVIFNIIVLGIAKYYGVFLGTLKEAGIITFKIENVVVLRISFYTFFEISYIVENYKGNREYVTFWDYLLDVCFFPKVLQGPIVLKREYLNQFNVGKNKKFNFENFFRGLYIFSLGLGKTIILADNFGKIVDYGYSHILNLNSFEVLITIIMYTLQIYYDFRDTAIWHLV